MATRNRKKNAISLLTEDHEKVRKLFSELEDTDSEEPDQRRELLTELERELKIHTMIEQEIFYPAFKVAAENTEDERLFYEAEEEHRVVDMLLPDVKQADPSTEVFAARSKVLREMVEHHADEEENDMFPTAKELMSDEQLQELGDQLATRKEELMSQWDGGSDGGNGGRQPRRTEGRESSQRSHAKPRASSHSRGSGAHR